MNNEPEYRQPSMAGHYVVAASIIFSAVLLACLLIWFWHPCCCCCNVTHPVAASVSTVTGPEPHITGSAYRLPRRFYPMARVGLAPTATTPPSTPKTDATGPSDDYVASAANGPYEQGTDHYHSFPVTWWTPSGLVEYPAHASTVPAKSSTAPKPPVEVPEPGALVMMLAGLPVVGLLARMRT